MADITSVERFLLEFPGFSQSFVNKYILFGNLKIKELYFNVKFKIPHFPRTQGINGYITKGLDSYPLPENSDNLQINEFIDLIYKYLQDIVDSKYSESIQETETCFTNYDISEELKKLKTHECKTLINKLHTVIRFIDFEKYPGHQLDLNIKSSNDIEIFFHTIPDCLFEKNNEFFRHTISIDDYLVQFEQILEQLHEFYYNLYTIDELCYVVEPVIITLKHNWRIFKLNEKVFIKVTINPLIPSSVEVNLLGPTQEVEKYREMYNEKAPHWDIDIDVYKNLLRIFNVMYFPMKDVSSEGKNPEKYCNICYMYTLDNHIPIISCDNPRCHLIFHEYCLKEWFSTLMDRTFLNVNLGICPFCKEKLSTSFVQLLED